MLSLRTLVGAVAALALVVVSPASVRAQGVTTGALTGTITDDAGQGVEGAQVQLRNARTGLNIGTLSRASGLYSIQGISPDNDYTIVVRRIGYAPLTRTGVVIQLGQTRREDFKLSREAAVLSTVTVTATTDPVINASKTGTSTTISDSALRRLPTLNRNFADFVQLVPQVSTTTGFLSGGGVNLRQNSIQIDGAQSGDLFGLGTTGQPGAQANGKSIPLDAVKEYQVLLSPFDVRQGNFGGLLINAVTKSGTNEFTGTVYADTRNQNLTRSQPYLNDRTQQHYSGSFGGPIVRDKLFFFVSGELQRLRTPTSGSYIGAPDQFVSQGSIDQVNSILSTKYGFTGAGGGEQIVNENPNRNVFARLDANLPFNTRLVLRHNYASADNTSFGRGNATQANPNFGLSSNQYQFSNTTHSTVGELLTNLPNGAYNELLFNYGTISDNRTVPVLFPQLTIRGIPRVDPGALPTQTANFVLGTEASSQGNTLDQRTFELTDNLTFPVGAHSFTVGTKNIFYKSINLFAQNSRGNWTFADLNGLNNGTPTAYTISAPAPTDPYNGLATIRANTYGVYAQDAWTVSPTLTITGGIRYDKPSFQNVPPENDPVFQQYGRHTSSVPTRGQLSPRLGFNWDVTGDQRNQLRGGIGSFAGNVPFVYLSNAFGNSGLSGFSSINCNNTSATTNLAPPIFTAAAAATPPLACDLMTAGVRTVGGGAAISGPAATANVATIDPDFRYPKYLKASLGFDHRFSGDVIGTLEGLYSRAQSNAFYQNLALAGPQGTDRFGRVLYGTITATGGTATLKVPGGRQQVIDVTNSSGDYTWSTTAQLQKSFSRNFEGSVAYTYQQSRDVVSVTSSTQGSNFRYQRDVSGNLLDKSVTRSKYDQPHRIVAIGTYRFPSLTDVSVIYTGNSGAPYDYVYGAGTGTGSGDLNADGQSQNDLMYVPLNVNDPNEILFTGAAGTPNSTAASQASAAAQAAAFDAFINSTPCLANARGTILTRNACRNPWVNEFDVSVAQSLGHIAGTRLQNLQLRMDIINFGNLLNRNWGRQAFSSQGSTCGQICSATVALVQSGNRLATGTTPTTGIFTFDPTFKAYSSDNVSSNYQMQLSLRYSF
ncbi:MAG: TonB-dependent receptor [Gemmatimonadaceae bacterium]|nr:TonB-dependent receptor [Gemmatimonadaceae bacterium]